LNPQLSNAVSRRHVVVPQPAYVCRDATPGLSLEVSRGGNPTANLNKSLFV
jgi:hypothetical protein